MADTHYTFNRNLPAGFRLGRAHESLDNAQRYLVDERNAMIQMRDGADVPGSPANYAGVTAAYGFSTDADAQAAFLELDSLVAKIGTDASVTGVLAAITQFLARFRN
jgi:hypothetical protein